MWADVKQKCKSEDLKLQLKVIDTFNFAVSVQGFSQKDIKI